MIINDEDWFLRDGVKATHPPLLDEKDIDVVRAFAELKIRLMPYLHHEVPADPARPNTVLPLGAVDDRPDHDCAESITLRLHEFDDGATITAEVADSTFHSPLRQPDRRRGRVAGSGVAGRVPSRCPDSRHQQRPHRRGVQ